MMKWFAALSFLLFGSLAANAQGAPCQWNYSFVDGAATATYCGNVSGNFNIKQPIILVYKSVSQLSSSKIPDYINEIYVSTVSSVNNVKGTCGLTYDIGTSTPTGVYGEVLNTSSEIYWEPQYSNSPVKACEFGTIGDGSYNFSTGVITGTDNTTMIQAAINYALQNDYNSVCLNDGVYKTTDTIQQGWGNSFYSISVSACGRSREAYNALAGVTILPTKIDRCAWNIQGGRDDLIRGMTFIGQNYTYNSGIVNGSSPFPTTITGWFNPALVPSGNNPGGLQQHSPYSGICIDAYSGTQPADAYPTVTYPSWTGIITQYNKDASSDTKIEDVQLIGFAVDVNSKPNGDGNGDFLKLLEVDCQYSTFCASINNTQSRAVALTNVTFNGVFAALVTNQFGLQNGQLDGPISNLSGGSSYEAFQIGTLGLSGPIIISNFYGENIVRIGVFSGNSGDNQSIVFNGGNVQLASSLNQIIPAALIEAPSPTSFTFHAFGINSGQRIDTLVHGAATVVMDGGNFSGGQSLGTLFNNAGVQAALNYTGSVFIGSAATFPIQPFFYRLTWLGQTQASKMSAPNSIINSYQNMGPNADFNANIFRAPFTQATKGFFDNLNNREWTFAAGPTGVSVNLASSGLITVPVAFQSCDVMTFTYEAAYQTEAQTQEYHLNVGDIIYHNNTGTIFVVTAIGSPDGSGNYPITTRQMNNMTVNRSTGACVTNNLSDPTLGGQSAFIHSGSPIEIPSNVFFGTFTNGSTTVTNVQRGDGYGGNLSSYIVAGDPMWTYPYIDAYFQWPYASGPISIASVTNGSPGSLTLSSNATLSGRFPILPLPIIGGPQ